MDPEEPSSSGAPSSGRRGLSEGSAGAASPRDVDEAEVDNDMDIDDRGDDEDEEGEDLFAQDFMERDYRASPGQDRYESEGIDDDFHDVRDMAEVLASQHEVNLELEERDRNISRVRKLPSILNEGDTSEDSRPRSRQRTTRSGSTSEAEDGPEDGPEDWRTEDEDDAEEGEENILYNAQGNLREWISREDVRRLIARKYRKFLHSFKSDNEGHKGFYVKLVEEMLAANKSSLELNYEHWIHSYPMLAVWLADAPELMLEVMEEVTSRFVMRLNPKYANIQEKIHLRIGKLPIEDQIRNIRHVHLNTLVKISGVVTRRSGVFPQLQQVKYDCDKCGTVLGPFFQNTFTELKVGSCPECQSKGPFTVNVEQTIYRNYQKLTLQESPGTVPPGRLPRYKEIIILDDLIDCARPGEEIEVTGIYVNNFDVGLNTKNGFPVFATVVEANHVSKKHDLLSASRLTEEDIAEIQQLAKDPRIGTRELERDDSEKKKTYNSLALPRDGSSEMQVASSLQSPIWLMLSASVADDVSGLITHANCDVVKSIAPSIYGHDDIKTALALAMFGGQEKSAQGKHRLRGDINVLLLGDPGTAKSQFLKYIEKTAQRAVYTTGKGASAVGLTAAVHKDPVTREWTLEGGALVLADRGVCLIDEFDKMNDQDRVSIHEAMEQQSISISKAGIVTSLQARCSVIAAANPVGGRYDSGKTFSQNVELTDPILSRFDILRVVKDIVDPDADALLARYVVESHHRSHPKRENDENAAASLGAEDNILSQEMLKKYITYAKQNIFPKLHDTDLEKISRVYADLRRESQHGQGVPIAVRHIESMIRMSEAHARMHLRQYVTEDDVDMAIRVLLESFISTQKYGVQKSLQKRFNKYMTFKRDFNELILHLLRGLVKDALRYEELISRPRDRATVIEIKLDDLEAKVREYEIIDLQPFFTSQRFLGAGFTLDAEQRVIRHRVV